MAVLYLDKCIKNILSKLNIEYNIIYNNVFTIECIGELLLENKVCSKLTIDECINNCNCFVLEGHGCLSKNT